MSLYLSNPNLILQQDLQFTGTTSTLRTITIDDMYMFTVSSSNQMANVSLLLHAESPDWSTVADKPRLVSLAMVCLCCETLIYCNIL